MEAVMLWILIGCANDSRVVDTISDVMDARGMKRLDLATTSENLVVVGTDDPEIAVAVELTTTRTSTSKDDKARDSLHLELRDDGAGQARAAVWFDRSIANYATDVAVFLPRSLDLSLLDEDGAVHVEKVATLELDDGNGDVEIADVAGEATITDHDGNLHVQGVGGDLAIDDGGGDIRVEDVAGIVTIHDGSGDIRVENATKVRVESDTSGEVTVK
jgi:hypothetical protein